MNRTMQPSNKDIHDLIANHIKSDDTRFEALGKAITEKPNKDEIEEIVINALRLYFERKGTTLKSVLIGTAVIVGAITVIFGGFKSMLAWLGFTYLGK